MTDRLLLDTHIAIWFDNGNDRLSATTRRLIEECWRDGGLLCFSAISVWELAMLVDAGRIGLDTTVEGGSIACSINLVLSRCRSLIALQRAAIALSSLSGATRPTGC